VGEYGTADLACRTAPVPRFTRWGRGVFALRAPEPPALPLTGGGEQTTALAGTLVAVYCSHAEHVGSGGAGWGQDRFLKTATGGRMHGGDTVAEVLYAQGVRFLFTLCGGHISPILVGCKGRGIRVVDTRHEATAVFAADAVARLTGVPGVAAVTAGPGVTNTVTAVKNAQMAQSPVVLIGGAAPTALQGRGALQDIDQISLVKPIVKWAHTVRKVRDLAPCLETAFRKSLEGVPGPVFVECPADLLYDEALVRHWYGAAREGRGLVDRAVKQYLRWHVSRLFAGAGDDISTPAQRARLTPAEPCSGSLEAVASLLERAAKPVAVIGSQAMLAPGSADALARAVKRLGVPVYLSGMARGLLGRAHPLHQRHQRRQALREADFVLLAGVPADFRLDYGNHIPRQALYVSLNRSRDDLRRNRRPDIGILGDVATSLRRMAALLPAEDRWRGWRAALRARDRARDAEIARHARLPSPPVNPVHLCREIDRVLGPDAVLVGDGGDFVATASYTIRPPGPLTWLDPGAFGTLGVGAGFALAAALCRPRSRVWLLYGDGAAGYSLAEFDTFVRHGIPVVAVVGNDAGWTQIAREQVEVLRDDVGTVLARTDYHRVAEGWGGAGLLLDDPADIGRVLAEARAIAARGTPVLINAHLGRTEFRKGSISL
jgi:acetolactate synthase-like protein